jgi:hypothetical protein
LQIETADKIYGGPKRSDNGTLLYPGWTFGSETAVMVLHGRQRSVPSRSDFWPLWVFANGDSRK